MPQFATSHAEDVLDPDRIISPSQRPSELATINKVLPPELLAMIFEAYRDLPGSKCRSRKCACTCLCWIPMVNICSAWRNIALSWPALWATIHVHSKEVVETFISRSGTCPLIIYIGTGFSHNLRLDLDDIVSCFCNAAHRIQHLHISITFNNAAVTAIRPLLARDTLSLKSLHVRSSYQVLYPNSMVLDSANMGGLHQGCQTFFGGVWPKLTSLTLYGDHHLPNKAPFNLWSILQSSASLQDLFLQGAYIRHQVTTSARSPLILPHLRDLNMCGGDVQSIAFILDHIEVSGPPKVRLDNLGKASGTPGFKALVSAITKLYSSQKYDTGYPQDLVLELDEESGKVFFKFGEDYGHLCLYNISVKEQAEILEALPLQSLSTFRYILDQYFVCYSLLCDSHPSMWVLATVVVSSPKLENLRLLNFRDLSPVLPLLVDIMHTTDIALTPFPHLRTLSIANEDTQFDDLLFNVLERSGAAGCLPKLVLPDCLEPNPRIMDQIRMLDSGAK